MLPDINDVRKPVSYWTLTRSFINSIEGRKKQEKNIKTEKVYKQMAYLLQFHKNRILKSLITSPN